MNTELMKRLADKLVSNIVTGHDWPNTDDEVLRLQCAQMMRQSAEQIGKLTGERATFRILLAEAAETLVTIELGAQLRADIAKAVA